MRGEGHAFRLGALVAGLAVVGAMQGVSGERPGGAHVRVVFPADRCVLESGKIDLLCVMPEAKPGKALRPALRVDRKARKWEPYEAPVLLSRLQLTEGQHDIVVGPSKLPVYVHGKAETPEEFRAWPVLRAHPGKDEGWRDCEACHAVTKQGGRTKLGDPREPAACLGCHTPQAFEAVHFHPLPPLTACHLCHAVHGSSSASLLRAPVKELCQRCHD